LKFGADVGRDHSNVLASPFGYGGSPNAALFCTKEEYKRSIPGSIIGVPRTLDGRPLEEDSDQRETATLNGNKATSNIWYSPGTIGLMAGMYAVYQDQRIKIYCSKVKFFRYYIGRKS